VWGDDLDGNVRGDDGDPSSAVEPRTSREEDAEVGLAPPLRTHRVLVVRADHIAAARFEPEEEPRAQRGDDALVRSVRHFLFLESAVDELP
jgi:hypothetical protein